MEKEKDNHQTDDDGLLDELFLQIGDRALDQVGPVIGGYNLHPFGQGRGDLLDLLFNPLDDIVGVNAETDHHDSAHHFSGPIQFSRTAADVRSQNDLADIFHQDRGAPLIRADDNVFDIGDVLDVPPAPDHVFPTGKLQDPRPRIPVSLADVIGHGHDGHFVSVEGIGVDVHLVLLDKTADGSHFSHPGNGLEPVTDVPILQGAQLGEVIFSGRVHQGVFKAPAYPGGIRPQGRGNPRRKLSRDSLHVLQDPGSGPVNIRSVFEDHVDEGDPEKRESPHDLHVRRSQEGCDNGIGDLVLYQRRASLRPFRVDDHLDIGEVRDGVQGGILQRPDARGNRKEGEDEDDEIDFSRCIR